jgi:hypothetical protein
MGCIETTPPWRTSPGGKPVGVWFCGCAPAAKHPSPAMSMRDRVTFKCSGESTEWPLYHASRSLMPQGIHRFDCQLAAQRAGTLPCRTRKQVSHA